MEQNTGKLNSPRLRLDPGSRYPEPVEIFLPKLLSSTKLNSQYHNTLIFLDIILNVASQCIFLKIFNSYGKKGC